MKPITEFILTYGWAILILMVVIIYSILYYGGWLN